MTFSEGDRVKYKDFDSAPYRGVVVKCIAPQGSFSAMCVVEWDDDSRGTVHASDLVPE